MEINVADEQIDDLLDDALQFFQERHFDGVEKTYLKYKLTQTDIDRGKGTAGITTTTVSDGGIDYDYEEDSRYLPLPDGVIGVRGFFILMVLITSLVGCLTLNINCS